MHGLSQLLVQGSMSTLRVMELGLGFGRGQCQLNGSYHVRTFHIKPMEHFSGLNPSFSPCWHCKP